LLWLQVTGFYILRLADMRLSVGDISRYYALANVKITSEDANEVERYTEGWIIAVYLQLSAFLETGTFSDTPRYSSPHRAFGVG